MLVSKKRDSESCGPKPVGYKIRQFVSQLWEIENKWFKETASNS